MFLGIKSIWRTRSRCLNAVGRAPAFPRQWRSRFPSTQATWRFQSTSVELAVEPRAPPSMDLVPISQMTAEVEDTNAFRNRMFRDAFRERSPERLERAKQKLSSTYVPSMRDYPSTRASKESRREALRVARLQAGFETIWKTYGNQIPTWTSTFHLLKRMTTRISESSSMAAVRIVLPKSWELALGNQKVAFVDSTTGLLAKLRVSGDHQNPLAIILRGKSSVLAKAADELVAKCDGVEVYRLGEVAAFGYEEKRLWPAIEDAVDGGSFIPEDKLDNIWIHEEHHTYWIDTPYEKTPRPKVWTRENFETYITTLVCGRLRPHLVLSHYVQPRKDGKLVDSDGIRIRIILNAFMDPTAKAHITPSVLKMALSFIAQKGGHRADADKLLTVAEEWGMPMDTEIFNIMLESYVAKRDVAFFHKFLLKMEQRYFRPNARTWLLFLELVQKEIERRQVIVGMYDLGLFDDPATRRGIARTMASHDAYVAFKSGKRLSVFMREQKSRYGDDWFTTEALNCILVEFFRFHDPDHRYYLDFQTLVDKQSEDGRKIGTDTINLILAHCTKDLDWETTIWALSKLAPFGCKPDSETYEHVIRLAIKARAPRALGVAFFYGAVEHKLRGDSRYKMRKVLLGHMREPFWAKNRPMIFSKKIGRILMAKQVEDVNKVVASTEKAIHQFVGDYQLVKPLAYALDVAWHTMDRPMHQRRKEPKGEDDAVIDDEVWVDDLAVRLRWYDENGDPHKMYVHLDGQFRPSLMVKKWDKDRERETRERLSGLSSERAEEVGDFTTAVE